MTRPESRSARSCSVTFGSSEKRKMSETEDSPLLPSTDSPAHTPPQRKWLGKLGRWFVPINLRRLLQTQGAFDTVFAFAFTVFFFCELSRPGTFTSPDTVRHMTKHELRRYLSFYLWYAFMYLAHLTVSLLMYLEVRNVKYNVDARRRTIFLFLVFSPTLVLNLILSAANVLYFPWAPLGLFYVLHTIYVTPYWLYAFRYYRWLDNSELVHFESPLVSSGIAIATEIAGPSQVLGEEEVGGEDSTGKSDPPAAVATARLVSIDDECTIAVFRRQRDRP